MYGPVQQIEKAWADGQTVLPQADAYAEAERRMMDLYGARL